MEYTPEQARAALDDVALRRRQLTGAVRPLPFWPLAVTVGWLLATGLLRELPTTPVSRAAYLVVCVLYPVGMFVANHFRPIRPRLAALGAGWWVRLVVGLALGVVVTLYAFDLAEEHTSMPNLIPSVVASAYLVLFALVANRWPRR
ncbi:hypothetical protein Sya03_32440 [Spirilliplanes yamanashiensis]|uniref:Transmembrane protein n=1 Tax=Spirilliplanes yamanashiensis TaxID=42233 RepID=A0A8J3Y9J7_9ACTN|nr:hypothetical protein Sya03_32440 [Spirilliplanes yamanashiensis]